MIVGQKVICVDDTFPPIVAKFYVALPVKNKTYVIRAVMIGINLRGESGEVCVYLKDMHNPKSATPPFPERGFNAERFRPLEELPDESVAESQWAETEKELVLK